MIKRIFDVGIVLLTAIITVPIMLFTSVLLLLTQGFPLIFSQHRIGRDGQTFCLYKFRTMRLGIGTDAERVTWIGRILRKLSIDELPELWNVLKGEMSLVGPRPLPVCYRDFYQPWEWRRHDVLPGLTGLAQVSGRNGLRWSEKFIKDNFYIANQSIFLDFKIIAKTFLALVQFSKVNATKQVCMPLLSDRLYILGAGGHAKVVYETALACNYEVAGIYDENPSKHGQTFFTHQIQDVARVPKGALVVCAVGNAMARQRLCQRFTRFATLLHPEANISKSARVKEGSVVFQGVNIQADTVIGKQVIINTNASIDHDCRVMDFAHIAPGATLCGQVTIGQRVLVAVGASVAPGCFIIADSTIAGGSTVIRSIEVPGTYAGSPAIIKKNSLTNDQTSIAMAKPDITEQEVAAVEKVIRSKRLALGENITEFESLVAKYVNRKHAIACSSGTAALHLSLMALGIGPGDEVMVPSYTFVASVNCILYVGATVVFVDINPETYTICLDDARNKITQKTKAIVSVDVFGHPADLDDLEQLCDQHNLYLVDDSCEALGAELNGQKVGKYGDFATFAFYPNKQITTGEGGMILTDNDEWARRCRAMLNQGRDAMSQWLEHVELGYNFRMSEIHASLGVVQMKRLEEILHKRQRVAHWYLEALKDVKGVGTQAIKENAKMSWFVFVITVAKGLDRDFIIEQLQERNIPARAYFTPIHTQPYLKSYPIKGVEELPVTLDIGKRTLALPFYGDMDKKMVEFVVSQLKEILCAASQSKNSQLPSIAA